MNLCTMKTACLVLFLSFVGMSCSRPGGECRLEAEIYYHVFDNLVARRLHPTHVLLRVPTSCLEGVVAKDSVFIELRCLDDTLLIQKIVPMSRKSDVLRLNGYYRGNDENGGFALISPDPYTFPVDEDAYDQIRKEEGRIKVVALSYARDNNRLVFQRFKFKGTLIGSPITVK